DHHIDDRLRARGEMSLFPWAGRSAGEASILRPVLGRILSGEQTAGERGPDGDADSVRSGHRQQLAFDATIDQRIGRLLNHDSGKVQLLRHPQGLDELPGREAACSDIANLACADKIVERAQRLVYRNLACWSVDVVDVEMVGA